MSDCPFCQLISEGLPEHGLYEDESFIVILDRESLGLGHCMIIPKRHVAKVYELDESEYAALFLLAKGLAPHLERATESKAVGYIVFGSGLSHAHLHLVPHNAPEDLLHPQVRKLSESELKANAASLRPFLHKRR